MTIFDCDKVHAMTIVDCDTEQAMTIFDCDKEKAMTIFDCHKEQAIRVAIKKNSCQTLGPASKRVLPDLLFFRNFLIFHFQYSMIKGTILKP